MAHPPRQAVLDSLLYSAPRAFPLGRRARIACLQGGVFVLEHAARLTDVALQRGMAQRRMKAMLLDGGTVTGFRHALQTRQRHGVIRVTRIVGQPQPQRQQRLIPLLQRQRPAQLQPRIARRGQPPRVEPVEPPFPTRTKVGQRLRQNQPLHRHQRITQAPRIHRRAQPPYLCGGIVVADHLLQPAEQGSVQCLATGQALRIVLVAGPEFLRQKLRNPQTHRSTQRRPAADQV